MQNIYSNLQETYPYLQACINMVACHSDSPAHIDIDSFIFVFSFYRHSLHELTRPTIHFPFSTVACTDQTVHTDVFLPLTQYTQDNKSIQKGVDFPLSQSTKDNSFATTSTFHRHLPHRLTCPHGHFIASDTAYTGQTIHAGIFFLLTQPTQAFPSMQTLSNFCRGLHKPISPHGHFLFTDVAHTGLLILQSISWPRETNLSTVTFSFH